MLLGAVVAQNAPANSNLEDIFPELFDRPEPEHAGEMNPDFTTVMQWWQHEQEKKDKEDKAKEMDRKYWKWVSNRSSKQEKYWESVRPLEINI